MMLISMKVKSYSNNWIQVASEYKLMNCDTLHFLKLLINLMSYSLRSAHNARKLLQENHMKRYFAFLLLQKMIMLLIYMSALT